MLAKVLIFALLLMCVMAVKIHLWSDAYICSSCGKKVGKEDEKCPHCGADFEGVVEEDEILKIEIKEGNDDQTAEAIRIFHLMSGATSLNPRYIEDLGKDLENSPFPEKISQVIAVMSYYSERFNDLEKAMDNMIKNMKKGKKEEILNSIDNLREVVELRNKILDHIHEVQINYGNVLEVYRNFLRKQATMLKKRIEEFQKEVERRKIQAKMLVEKEKELIEREHKLREKEKSLEGELKKIEDSGKKMEVGEITKEEWMEQQRKIQDKLYKIRDEVVKKKGDEKEKLTKQVLKILDDLLEKLPDEVIDEFARSKNFELYKKVMELYGLGGGSGAS